MPNGPPGACAPLCDNTSECPSSSQYYCDLTTPTSTVHGSCVLWSEAGLTEASGSSAPCVPAMDAGQDSAVPPLDAQSADTSPEASGVDVQMQ